MSLIDIPLLLIGIVFLVVVVRMALGPSQGDRAVAADLSFFCFISMVALFGARQGLTAAFDVVLIATLSGLVATLWLSRLIRTERAPEGGTPAGGAPADDSTPGGSTPGGSAPGGSAPDDTAPDDTAPDDTSSDGGGAETQPESQGKGAT